MAPSRQGLGTRPQLGDEVAARLREQIMEGRIRPGQYLRLERLAAEFGISVTPVREALQSLRSQGFVLLEPRRGFVVAPLSRQDVQDLFWVQADIAAELAARAATTLTTGTLRELNAIQHAMGRSVEAGRIDLVEEHNHDFHRCINLAARSAKLAWSLGAVARYVPRGLYGRLPDWPRIALEDHRRILAALREADPEETGAAMRAHIMRAGELLIAHLERQGLWNGA
ncbi:MULTISPECIES: GntR family transcriptional regulator [Thermomonospora]|uniref:Transcriptional regulator, GntR family n=1 Tax=Thermomonospora curvata (strain ATCC 19995 / DSM 43183 / JCM 3096 / KCTC 9072 / NBRC 15933 / NCIMB 10081 / Henssen B9) TaxID=471852 RepID=D1A3B7_THECD|nr:MULTISPECIES: GntR family transcriptional regulator [Thermomonospora]ACY99887.1 transcriptional regulator, GntR family [Thermomonospora curvata DSM 43183]PKK12889.1 MAG: GntR family transcriptional regulator [Thermomonospora sp. CIF 1]